MRKKRKKRRFQRGQEGGQRPPVGNAGPGVRSRGSVFDGGEKSVIVNVE